VRKANLDIWIYRVIAEIREDLKLIAEIEEES